MNDTMDKRDSLKLAIRTYKDLEQSKHCDANNITYTTLLTALRNLLPREAERARAVRSVFESAAKNGYVDQQVVQRTQSCLSLAEQRELFEADMFASDGSVRVGRLPAEWGRNVNIATQRRS